MFRPELFGIRKNLFAFMEMSCFIEQGRTADATARSFVYEKDFHANVANEDFVALFQPSADLDWKLQGAFIKLSGAGSFIQASAFRHLLLLLRTRG